MTKIIDFPQKVDKAAIAAWEFTQDIDAVIRQHVSRGMNPNELCALLAHRLGAAAAVAHNVQQTFSSLDLLLDFLDNYMRRTANGKGKEEENTMGPTGGTD